MIERIKKIMEYAEITPARFAEVVGINRAAMSHYLSGRNNPSLEVLNKILDVYQEINPIWLYRGIGEMFTPVKNDVNTPDKDVNKPEPLTLFTDVTDEEIEPELPQPTPTPTVEVEQNFESNSVPVNTPILPSPRTISKIIVYYSDQTFEIFTKDQLPIF